MKPDVSLVLVTYRSSAVVGEAVASFRAEAERSGVRGEVVLVDHSEDPGEVARLAGAVPDALRAQANLGYAAGVNAGVELARGATVVAGNPDIRFLEGSLGRLLGALDSGWDVVGPQFVLGELLFPPADDPTPAAEAGRWLASRSRALWHRRFLRELRRWLTVWGASDTLAMPALSGALLAFGSEVFARVGRWDEGYFLYFEETEWLRRAGARGARIGLMPAARVEHLWGHAADPLRHGERAIASRSRFLASQFGWRGRLASALRPRGSPLAPERFPQDPAALPPGDLLWLLSPTALGLPSAGLRGPASAFLRSLKLAVNRHGGRVAYLVIAVREASEDVVGVWAVEGCHG